MKLILGAASAVAALCLATHGWAEAYKDYTPQKGAWQVQEIHVDPNHVDDYLVGLRTSYVPGQEIAKKHGLIDSYLVLVRMDAAGDGANVMLVTHFPSLSALEPDKARDQALLRENLAVLSKEKGEALTNGFDKYRAFVRDGYWQGMDFGK